MKAVRGQSLSTVRDLWRVSSLQPGRGLSPEPDHADTLILNFQPPELRLVKMAEYKELELTPSREHIKITTVCRTTMMKKPRICQKRSPTKDIKELQ